MECWVLAVGFSLLVFGLSCVKKVVSIWGLGFGRKNSQFSNEISFSDTYTSMRDFRKLTVWQEAIQLSTEVYRITESFPKEERYGIVSQMQRCSVSIASNIAEGCSKKSPAHFAHYIEIAIGSAFELETQLIISNNMKFLGSTSYEKVLQSLNILEKRLNALRTALYKQKDWKFLKPDSKP